MSTLQQYEQELTHTKQEYHLLLINISECRQALTEYKTNQVKALRSKIEYITLKINLLK